MHHFAKWLVVGVIVPVGAFGVGDASAQSFTASSNAPAVGSSSVVTPADVVRPTAAVIVDRLLEKNKERSAALEHYESERTYRVEYTGTGGEHHAELRVRAEYSRPDQKRFTVVAESGSKFLCDKVLRKLVESEQEATAQSNRVQTTLGPEKLQRGVGR